MGESTILQLQQLSAGFDNRAVVEGLNLDVQRGTITAIAGGNGAGKSTALKTIARLLVPVGGKILLEGAELNSLPLTVLAKKIAYVPQDISSSRELTVEEMISLGRNPHQRWWQWRSDKNDKAALDEAISATELTDLRAKSISEISGGEKQRAAIAMSLAQQPELLLLDEPTAHLDFKHQKSLMKLLLKLKNEGMTVIACLHDLNFIWQTCDQVICLKKQQNAPSKQLFAGPPQAVLTGENLQSAFDTDLRIIQDPVETNSKFFGL